VTDGGAGRGDEMGDLKSGREYDKIDDRMRILWLAIRQALLIALGAIEEFLGLERTRIPKHKREEKR
jgi:hypothetical protein